MAWYDEGIGIVKKDSIFANIEYLLDVFIGFYLKYKYQINYQKASWMNLIVGSYRDLYMYKKFESRTFGFVSETVYDYHYNKVLADLPSDIREKENKNRSITYDDFRAIGTYTLEEFFKKYANTDQAKEYLNGKYDPYEIRSVNEMTQNSYKSTLNKDIFIK